MAYSKRKNRTSTKSFNPKNAGNRKKIKRKKARFPTSPIKPKANQLAPQKIVRRVPGSSDRFEVFDDELTPFGRACIIESETQAPAEYTLRDDFDYSLGSISIKPADVICTNSALFLNSLIFLEPQYPRHDLMPPTN